MLSSTHRFIKITLLIYLVITLDRQILSAFQTPSGLSKEDILLKEAGKDGKEKWLTASVRGGIHSVAVSGLLNIAQMPKELKTLHEANCHYIALAGKHFVRIYLVRPSEKQKLLFVEKIFSQNTVRAVTFSGNNGYVAYGDYDGEVFLYKITGHKSKRKHNQRIHRKRLHIGRVNSVKISQDNKILVSGGADGSVKAWNLKTWQSYTLHRHQNSVTQVLISSNYIVSTSYDRTIMIYDMRTREKRLLGLKSGDKISLHSHWISGASISEDGKTVLSSGYDRQVIQWTLVDRDTVTSSTVGRHFASIYRMFQSSKGDLLVSIDLDGTVRVWKAGAVSSSSRREKGLVTGMGISPDGTRRYSIDNRGELRVQSLN
ncbi:MAG: hypothetical protein OEZ36_02445 [Spirochaetota bacterium]|nr:hypothetical protein [Spirochaetota bacterium]